MIAMSYQLNIDEKISDGVARIAYEQTGKALKELKTIRDGYSEDDALVNTVDEAIHDARKCFKKVRAVLRLVRKEIGEEAYRAENVCFRNAGRQLADLRDSHVRIETLDELTDYFSDQLDKNAFHDLRQTFVAQHKDLRSRFLTEMDNLNELIANVEEAQARIQEWPVDSEGLQVFRGGLRKTYKRGYNRMAEAYGNPSPERFHEWRKRVKYHWYHLRILNPLWPNVLSEVAEEVHKVADYLGDAHDFAELHKYIEAHDPVPAHNKNTQVLLALLTQRQRELEAAAQPLGARIYTESPKRYMKRVKGYWSVVAN